MSAQPKDLTTSHRPFEAQPPGAGGHLLPNGHLASEAHPITAVGDTSAVSHLRLEAQAESVGGTISPTPTISQPRASLASSGWEELRLCADLLWRAQEERKAVANMLRHTDADMFGHVLANVEATEHAAKLMLRRCYKRVVPASIQTWQKASKGVGTDSLARILGHLGDPYIATPHWWEGTGTNRVLMQGEPYVRTISQLWQYCGHGAPSRRVRGMTADDAMAQGNPAVKMLVHLQAEWCMRQVGTYRSIYDKTREAVADKTHTVECVRCGPSGKPAQPGSPWSAGHQHAHALRIVGKELLRDMWLARHEEEDESA